MGCAACPIVRTLAGREANAANAPRRERRESGMMTILLW
jgi:hypothetical protein